MQLSFALPFTRQERIGTALGWRCDPDKCADLRYHLLLKSFVSHFKQSDLKKFCVICPTRDCARAEELLRTVTTDERYEVIPEDLLLSTHEEQDGSPLSVAEGWYIQQIIKIGIARYLSTEFYITLDSDVVCMHPFAIGDLLVPGPQTMPKAVVNIERRNDYEYLYKVSFSEKEIGIKEGRYRASASLLGYERHERYRGQYYGETPCVIHTPSMRAMLDYIEGHYRERWWNVLARTPGWTEYGLYFQFLEMTGNLGTLCELSHCNRVLDLELSVWQATEWYRTSRLYDSEHFFPSERRSDRGLFVAVQSWLPLDSWLPERYRSLGDFYADLTRWTLCRGS